MKNHLEVNLRSYSQNSYRRPLFFLRSWYLLSGPILESGSTSRLTQLISQSTGSRLQTTWSSKKRSMMRNGETLDMKQDVLQTKTEKRLSICIWNWRTLQVKGWECTGSRFWDIRPLNTSPHPPLVNREWLVIHSEIPLVQTPWELREHEAVAGLLAHTEPPWRSKNFKSKCDGDL